MFDERLRERLLVLLLRIAGAIMLLAAVGIFLPVEWMAATHRWLGLGRFPESPIVDYLARSISALYTLHGGLLLVLSTDVRRHAPTIVYVACANLVVGVVILGIDVGAGMPWFWTLVEGPSIVATGVVLLALVRSLPPRHGAGA